MWTTLTLCKLFLFVRFEDLPGTESGREQGDAAVQILGSLVLGVDQDDGRRELVQIRHLDQLLGVTFHLPDDLKCLLFVWFLVC